MEEHVTKATVHLREVFGPQAKLVVHTLEQRQQPFNAAVNWEDPPDCEAQSSTTEETALHISGVYYRASATFRLLGFPVEVASARGPHAQATIENCVRQALSSDVEFIPPHGTSQSQPPPHHPSHSRRNYRHRQPRSRENHLRGPQLRPHQLELKVIVDELRELCMFFSRSLKFSIKAQRAVASGETETTDGAGNAVAVPQWRCRAYLKDEWSVVARMAVTEERSAESPKTALTQCLVTLRARYKEEMGSAEVMEQSVRELTALVAERDRLVSGRAVPECKRQQRAGNGGDADPAEGQDGADAVDPIPADLQVDTYSGVVEVEDSAGNTTVYQTRRQRHPLEALQAASVHAMRSESLWLPDTHRQGTTIAPTPLLVRVRWQFEETVARIAAATGCAPHEVASVTTTGAQRLPPTDETCRPDREPTESPAAQFFTASFTCDGSVVWQATSSGRYRVEFDAYVQALHYLLDQYPDVVENVGVLDRHDSGPLFPSSEMLALAVARHDGYDVLQNHRGKWNCYALLGTLTSQLIGGYYRTTYQYLPETSEWCATLHVSDGARPDQLLIARVGRQKGEAWRTACIDALRDNFPRQYAAALRAHPDVDLSGDNMARGTKFRALPREKRVQHMGTLFAVIAAFAEEDMGWHQLRIRLRNASGDIGLPQWVAELEAQVEGEEGRRVVAVSLPYAQVRQARRTLIYKVAAAYFPKELAMYKTLPRADHQDPETDLTVRRTRIYQPGGPPFVLQLTALMESKRPSLRPIVWNLRTRSLNPAVEDERGWSAILEGEADEHTFPERLLVPLADAYAYEAEVLGNRGDVLITEHSGAPGESAVSVLIAALRAASQHVAGADAESIWMEYETHSPPSMSHSRELALYLFQTFFGAAPSANFSSGRAATSSETAACVSPDAEELVAATLRVDSVQLSTYWFSTVRLPCCDFLPVARAVGATKKGSVKDVLVLAARMSFPRMLQYMAARDPAMASLASDILADTAVERLSAATCRDLRSYLERQRRQTQRPPPPLKLLLQCVAREHGQRRFLRIEKTQEPGAAFRCRLYLQKNRREVKKGEVQLVGCGIAMSVSQAQHAAAVMALQNLFEQDLLEAMSKDTTYGEWTVVN